MFQIDAFLTTQLSSSSEIARIIITIIHTVKELTRLQ
jgi:hypothetical protein